MVIWEEKYKQKWKEYKISLPHLEEKKKHVIKNIRLRDNVFTLEDLNNSLQNEGIHFSLSLREKIQFLNEQQSYIEALKTHYVDKKEGLLSEMKSNSINKKMQMLLEKEVAIQEELKALKEDYRLLFKEESKIKT